MLHTKGTNTTPRQMKLGGRWEAVTALSSRCNADKLQPPPMYAVQQPDGARRKPLGAPQHNNLCSGRAHTQICFLRAGLAAKVAAYVPLPAAQPLLRLLPTAQAALATVLMRHTAEMISCSPQTKVRDPPHLHPPPAAGRQGPPRKHGRAQVHASMYCPPPTLREKKAPSTLPLCAQPCLTHTHRHSA